MNFHAAVLGVSMAGLIMTFLGYFWLVKRENMLGFLISAFTILAIVSAFGLYFYP